MRKGQKRWVNDYACTMTYEGVKRKCFGSNWKHLSVQFGMAAFRQFKIHCNMNLDSIVQVSNNEWYGHTLSAEGKKITWKVIDRKDRIKEAAKLLGQIGGQAGYGKKKVRGDSNYYRVLRQKGIDKAKKKKDNK